MSYPLTGASLTATIKAVVTGGPTFETNPTRGSATVPFSGIRTPYSRGNISLKKDTPKAPPMTTNPVRQWGLAPTFKVVSDGWGVF